MPNKGTDLTQSGRYAAYVKQAHASPGADDASVARLRAASDQRLEEEQALHDMAAYHHGHATEAGIGADAFGSCNVCTAAEPCLFDVIADPQERTDLSKANPGIVKQLQAKLQTFSAYIGQKMTPKEYAPYECTVDIRPWWGNFSGPCCRPKQPTVLGQL